MSHEVYPGRQPITEFSRQLRERGWTTATLAAEIGYSEKAVGTWRTGARYPSRGARHLLAQVLKITETKLEEYLDTFLED